MHDSPTSVFDEAIFRYAGESANTIAMPTASMTPHTATSGMTRCKKGLSEDGKILPDGQSAQYVMSSPENPTVK